MIKKREGFRAMGETVKQFWGSSERLRGTFYSGSGVAWSRLRMRRNGAGADW